jgi:hypothetical protein
LEVVRQSRGAGPLEAGNVSAKLDEQIARVERELELVYEAASEAVSRALAEEAAAEARHAAEKVDTAIRELVVAVKEARSTDFVAEPAVAASRPNQEYVTIADQRRPIEEDLLAVAWIEAPIGHRSDGAT